MKNLANWSARTPVAANILMFLILIGGAMSLLQMRREFFPQFALDMIVVSVPYPGASPEEIEEGICVKIEEKIEGIDGIKTMISTASEGVGSVLLELERGVEQITVYNDIKSEVDQIFTFPVEAEEPNIRALTYRQPAIFVALYSDSETSERVLRDLAEGVRDDLTATSSITSAFIEGDRRPEISIEVSEADLRRYSLTFDDVARAVRQGSVDMPAGKIKTRGSEIVVRAKGRRYTGREYENVPLITLPDGAIIRLGQVANVVDGFEDVDRFVRFNGQNAMLVQIMGTATQDVVDIANAVHVYVKKKRPELPKGIEITAAFDSSTNVRDRIDLLQRNAIQGLTLVFICLCIFLRMRLAFWVAVGIPISFMGGFILLYIQDATINMISLFGFIIVLGIVVDDAIIVGENIYAHFRQGATPFRAAVDGAAEVGWPVFISVTTTIVAFMPLFFISGMMGKFIGIMPMVVVTTLVVSLLEAFLILPAHLKHSLERGMNRHGGALKPGWRHRMIQAAIDKVYAPFFIRPALRYRYIVAAAALALVILSAGIVAGGRIGFIVLPKVDSDKVTAAVVFPEGTPVGQTEAAVNRLEKALAQVNEEWTPKLPAEALKTSQSLVRNASSLVGAITRKNATPGARGAHVAEITVELLPTQDRGEMLATDILARWRELTGDIPGAEELVFAGEQHGPGGMPVEIRLLGRDLKQVEAAAEELKRQLTTYAGVYDIRDDFEPGKWEIKIKEKKAAKNLGLTLDAIARQVRQGFYGAEALRIQRGRDEMKIMARYTRDERRLRSTLEQMRIRVPRSAAPVGRNGKNAGATEGDGRRYDEIPLKEVAQIDYARGYSTIRRIDRKRAVTVTADLDESQGNSREIMADLTKNSSFWPDFLASNPRISRFLTLLVTRFPAASRFLPDLQAPSPSPPFLPELMARYPGVSYDLEGQARETSDSMSSLMLGFAYALLGIFCLLAAQFRSYIQPVIVMCAIPVALVGALAGHLIMGMELTLISVFGLVALAGIVVNDSLVLIDFINRKIASGVEEFEAVVLSGQARFRAIVLTSITTIAGLAPLLIERSMQARILLPMAVSIAFGLMAATVLTLVITPCVYLIVADIKRLFGIHTVAGFVEEMGEDTDNLNKISAEQ